MLAHRKCDDLSRLNFPTTLTAAAASDHPLDRKRLEQMAKYLCRPAISAERLELLPNNEVRVKLKTAWRDGTESVRYSAVQFLLRLAAIIPLPHRPAIIYHGAFAPNQQAARRRIPGGGSRAAR